MTATETTTNDIEDYVRTTAHFLSLPLADGQVERVALHLGRTRAMMAPLLDMPLHAELEPAEIYCPAPFPPGDDEKSVA